jgi:hypothetical protein
MSTNDLSDSGVDLAVAGWIPKRDRDALNLDIVYPGCAFSLVAGLLQEDDAIDDHAVLCA